MISVSAADIEKKNIVRMVLDVITTYALVWDLKQLSCNMARDHKSNSMICNPLILTFNLEILHFFSKHLDKASS